MFDCWCLQPELRLRYLKLSVSLEFDKANAEVGSSKVDGQVRPSLVPTRPSKHVGGKHSLRVKGTSIVSHAVRWSPRRSSGLLGPNGGKGRGSLIFSVEPKTHNFLTVLLKSLFKRLNKRIHNPEYPPLPSTRSSAQSCLSCLTLPLPA